MSKEAQKSKSWFEENLEGLNPISEKENYNLYKGLAALAAGLDAIEKDLADIKSRLARLEKQKS